MRKDNIFFSSYKRALHLARISPSSSFSSFLTLKDKEEIEKKILDPVVALFFQICWFFAGRVGDVRQVRRDDFLFNEEENN